jgi:hypothetical protein
VLLTQSTAYLGSTSLGNDKLTSAKVRKLGANDFDARCSDPHAMGRFICRIDQPPVNRAEAPMPSVVFAGSDIVYVGGDGCVQTGSHFWSGSTWKRYINPSGGGADHLYHGLVRIPGGSLAGTDVGNTLTRIEHVAGRPIQVLTDGSPTGDLQLHLGYEDDNYDDNNYSDHDDGTEDQCKTDGPNYGGPAFVEITICRGISLAQCEAPASRFPFNVRSSEFDPNGFLYNPHWSWQERPEISVQRPLPAPNTSLCHEFTQAGPLLALHWYAEPNLPDCTDQAGADTLNQPSDVSANNIICSGAPTPVGFSGHINWFAVTVKGHAGRISHDTDDDWDFSFPYEDSTKGSLYYDHVGEKPRQFLHAEFDSDETVDNFKSDAWTALHSAIDNRESVSDELHYCQSRNPPVDCSALQGQSNDAWALADKLFVGDAIITGLFGIDGEHGEKTELHPVYAFASNLCARGAIKNGRCDTPNDPSDDPWLMFVRNVGDEGFCSDGTWGGGFDDYTFQLPWREGMQSVSVNWEKSQFDWNGESSERPEVTIVPPLILHPGDLVASGIARWPPHGGKTPGVYVTFHLKYPTVLPPGDSSASYPFVDGALHLVWIPVTPPAANHPTIPVRPLIGSANPRGTDYAAQGKDRDDEKDPLEIALNHLSVKKRQQVLRVRAAALPKTSAAAVIPSIAAPTVKSHSPVAGPVGPATRKIRRDAALIKALCAASDDKPYGIDRSICVPKPPQPGH